MQEELRSTWNKMLVAEGEEYRRNVIALRETMRKSWEGGGTRESMLKLTEFFSQKE